MRGGVVKAAAPIPGATERAAAAADWTIRNASTAADFASARALFEEYAESLDVDLCFQDFASELANLPGDYAPPGGCLLLLRRTSVDATQGNRSDAEAPESAERNDDVDTGCVALRPIGSTGASELKRLYLRAGARGGGLGRALTLAAIERARSIGYREIKLDTLATMDAAQRLYAGLGFRHCAPYYRNPLPGVVWLSLDLVNSVVTSAPTEGPPSSSR